MCQKWNILLNANDQITFYDIVSRRCINGYKYTVNRIPNCKHKQYHLLGNKHRIGDSLDEYSNGWMNAICGRVSATKFNFQNIARAVCLPLFIQRQKSDFPHFTNHSQLAISVTICTSEAPSAAKREKEEQVKNAVLWDLHTFFI